MNDCTEAQILSQAAGLDRMSEHPLARPSSLAPRR
jgi:cation transport ATPase